jgi:hypothetical protein
MDSRIDDSSPPDPTPFFDAAFVGEQSNGPLYVTTSDGDALQIVSFTTGGREVLSRLGWVSRWRRSSRGRGRSTGRSPAYHWRTCAR